MTVDFEEFFENESTMTAEASEMGMAPGEWPALFLIRKDGKIEKAMFLKFQKERGEIKWALYSATGIKKTLKIFNT